MQLRCGDVLHLMMLRCLDDDEGEVLRTAKGFTVGVVRLFLVTLHIRNQSYLRQHIYTDARYWKLIIIIMAIYQYFWILKNIVKIND
jgi:hypothetical protein